MILKYQLKVSKFFVRNKVFQSLGVSEQIPHNHRFFIAFIFTRTKQSNAGVDAAA